MPICVRKRGKTGNWGLCLTEWGSGVRHSLSIHQHPSRLDTPTEVRLTRGLVRRQGLRVLIAGLLPTLLAAALLQVWPERFTATALVMVDQALPQMVDPAWDDPDGNTQNRRVASQAALARSDAVLRRAIGSASPLLTSSLETGRGWALPGMEAAARDGSVRERDETVRLRDDDETMVSSLRERVRFSRQHASAVIAIEVMGQGAEVAAGWANALAEAFLAEQAAHNADVARRAHAVLTAQAAALAQRVRVGQARLEALQSLQTPALPDAARLRAERRQLESELEADRSLYRQTYEQLQRAALAMEARVADGSLISPALVPAEPSHPKTALVLALVAFGGLAAGIAGALRAEARGEGDLDAAALEAMGLPVVAAIPSISSRHALLQDDAFAGRPGPVCDALRALAMALEGSGTGDCRAHCLLVTSPDEGAGKTSVALAFALHAARMGRRTLLIDAVFQAPQITRVLGFAGRSRDGQLSDLLAGRVGPDRLLCLARREVTTGLDVLANADPAADMTGRLLTTDTFAGLLEGARTAYDVVVIDSPATESSADAVLLARFATMIALCVRFGRTRRSDVQGTVDALAGAAPASCVPGRSPALPKLVGVLNGVPSHAMPRSAMPRHATPKHTITGV